VNRGAYEDSSPSVTINPKIDIKILMINPYFRRLAGLFFAFHLSYPSLVAAKTPRLKKKPPINKNMIERVYSPHTNPSVALTNSEITNTIHLSTNDEMALCGSFNSFLRMAQSG
jgi:uncharacterized protein YneF (UPF0154 family)